MVHEIKVRMDTTKLSHMVIASIGDDKRTCLHKQSNHTTLNESKIIKYLVLSFRKNFQCFSY